MFLWCKFGTCFVSMYSQFQNLERCNSTSQYKSYKIFIIYCHFEPFLINWKYQETDKIINPIFSSLLLSNNIFINNSSQQRRRTILKESMSLRTCNLTKHKRRSIIFQCIFSYSHTSFTPSSLCYWCWHLRMRSKAGKSNLN